MAKYAVLVNADTEQVGPAANGLEYALDLAENGHQVEVFFDGAATQWIPELEGNEKHPVYDYYEQAREQGLVGGACGYCATSFGVYDEVEEAGVEPLGGQENHGPHVGDLVDEGYELLTVG